MTIFSTRPPLKPGDITTEDVMPEGLSKTNTVLQFIMDDDTSS